MNFISLGEILVEEMEEINLKYKIELFTGYELVESGYRCWFEKFEVWAVMKRRRTER